jgi:hypothetical protein
MEMAQTIAERVKEERRSEMLADVGGAAETNPRIRAAIEAISGWDD